MARRLQERHLIAIMAALDADITLRSEAAYDVGERVEPPRESGDAIDSIVPDQQDALKIVRERLNR